MYIRVQFVKFLVPEPDFEAQYDDLVSQGFTTRVTIFQVGVKFWRPRRPIEPAYNITEISLNISEPSFDNIIHIHFTCNSNGGYYSPLHRVHHTILFVSDDFLAVNLRAASTCKLHRTHF